MSTNPPPGDPAIEKGATLSSKTLVEQALSVLQDKEDLEIKDILAELSKNNTPLEEGEVIKELEELGYDIEIVDPPTKAKASNTEIPPTHHTPSPVRKIPSLKELNARVKTVVDEKYEGKRPPALEKDVARIMRDISNTLKLIDAREGKKKTPEDKEKLDDLYLAFERLVEDFEKHTPSLEEPKKEPHTEKDPAKTAAHRTIPTLKELRARVQTVVDEKYGGENPPALEQDIRGIVKNITDILAEVEKRKGKRKTREEKEELDNLYLAFERLVEDFEKHTPNLEGAKTETGDTTEPAKRGWSREMQLHTEPAHTEEEIAFLRSKGWTDDDFKRHKEAHISEELLRAEKARLEREIKRLEERDALTPSALFEGEKWLLKYNLRPNLAEINKTLAKIEAKKSPAIPSAVATPSPVDASSNSAPSKTPETSNDLLEIAELAKLHQKRLSLQQLVESTMDLDARTLFEEDLQKVEEEIQERMKTAPQGGAYEASARIEHELISTPSSPHATNPNFLTLEGQKQARIDALLNRLTENPDDVAILTEVAIGLAKETNDPDTIAENNLVVTMAQDETGPSALSHQQEMLREEIGILQAKLTALGFIAHKHPVNIATPPSPETETQGETATLEKAATAGIEHIERMLDENMANAKKNWTTYGKAWALNAFTEIGEQYSKAPLKLKLALSATLIGAGLFGGGAVAGAIGSIALAQRAFGFAGTYVGVEAVLARVREQKFRKGKELGLFTSHTKATASVLAALLGSAAPYAFSYAMEASERQIGSLISSPEGQKILAAFFSNEYVQTIKGAVQDNLPSPKGVSVERATTVATEPSAPTHPVSPTTSTGQTTSAIKQFTDAIDRPGDSVWRSMKEIIRNNAEDFGWKENNITSKELWLDRRVAEIMQNNPDIAQQNLVHEGGQVHLEIVDGNINAYYEPAKGFENAPQSLPEKIMPTPVTTEYAPQETSLSTTPTSPVEQTDVPTIIHPTDIPDETPPASEDGQIFEGAGNRTSTSIETKVADTPKTTVEQVLSKAELLHVQTEVVTRIDSEFAKPSFFGFGGVPGVNTTEWSDIQKIPASEILAAPSFEKLNIRFKELVPDLTPYAYEKAHHLLLEASKQSGTIPVSSEDSYTYLTRSVKEQFIKSKYIA
jgi:hypothetical protein